MRKLLLILAVASTGCAAGLKASQPVRVVCAGCAVAQAAGICGAPMARVALPTCAEGQELYIANYKDFLEKAAAPKLACR